MHSVQSCGVLLLDLNTIGGSAQAVPDPFQSLTPGQCISKDHKNHSLDRVGADQSITPQHIFLFER